ncbi:hypothetical protein [Streptomyces cupreus]|uniref:SMI1/KNR4 family protein n=1 Tax=Streptomyces cupreus TaxID=2759956 RepID=A0A7X1JB18_9ACTN|nr:hypothetical protein [Streptomyces cupreus]MBC2907010.1 hypothetical protein [Streptomyces cupreus]
MRELVSLTGWQAERQEMAWIETEREFGTPLPADFKEICEVFGRGSFCGYLELLLPVDSSDPYSLVGRWEALKSRADSASVRSFFEPYLVFDGSGIILWGVSVTEASYGWLADTATPAGKWPVVARTDPLEEWHRFDVSTAEFICKVLTDREFRPVSVAAKVERPFFQTYG